MNGSSRSRRFFARSDPSGLDPDASGAKWQLLVHHLDGVSAISRSLALSTGSDDPRFPEIAAWGGLLHDLGKYTDEFQSRLMASAAGRPAERAPHSAHGAAVALSHGALDAAFALAGHHSGLPAPQGSASSLRARAAPLKERVTGLVELAREDFAQQGRSFPPGWPPETPALNKAPGSRELAELSIRMLGSVVVDADRLDAGGRSADERVLHDAGMSLQRLMQYVSRRAEAVASPTVRDARRDVLAACLAAAEWPERLLSLTVPTGGGKTLAATAFALKRAIVRRSEVRRLVYVVPYLSIIEQNAAVLAEVIGADAILEHHSGELIAEVGRADGTAGREGVKRDAWLWRENWNAPVVVTTTVRFFDTLFSNRPAALRRLHALARSVVILDEVQTLPRGMVGPILTMLRDLASHWKTTFVFCTATQPAFERSSSSTDRRLPRGTIREIAPPDLNLSGRLRRAVASWPGEGERLDRETVADRMAAEERVLCIVNTTRQARSLFEALAHRVEPETCWHLSARMCPIHRLEVLSSVREALKAGRRCRVVATQVVEAGVDLDFPLVLRAMAPLDSIVQAAGRCDREGDLTERAGHPAGRLVVFEPALDGEADGPPGVYREATGITRRLAGAGPLRLEDASAMSNYFDELYAVGPAALDAEGIDDLRKGFDFPAVAERFRIISDDSRPVIVEWNDPVRAALRMIAATGRFLPEQSRLLQRASVSLHSREFDEVRRAGTVYELFEGSDLWIVADGAYRQDVGFVGRIDMPLIA